ncbi:MAG: methylated-DNA--[protein]-cysteine S-methyltransferase [Pirellulaceae bacterium]
MRRIETRLGSLVACWTEQGLYSLEFEKHAETLAGDSARISSGPLSDSRHQELVGSVEEYFESGEFRFDLVHLDFTGVTDFHQIVLRLCAEIVPGQTLTYGQLATLAGSPQAARAVGGAMAKNRWPLLIPCHRVVGASGKLTGYSGTGGVDTKAWLLEHEQVAKKMKTGLLAL